MALLAALDAAPPDGLSADEVATRVGRSRAWVFSRLDAHATAGRAVRLHLGRWAGWGERRLPPLPGRRCAIVSVG